MHPIWKGSHNPASAAATRSHCIRRPMWGRSGIVPVELPRILAEVWTALHAGNISWVIVQPGKATLVVSHMRAAARDLVRVDDINCRFPFRGPDNRWDRSDSSQ